MGEASPLTYEAKLIQEHKERRQRIAARAVPDSPVVCLGALARSSTFVNPPSQSVAESAVVVPKEPWFWITEDIGSAPCPSIRKIQKVCCEYFGIDLIDLLSQRRNARLVRARQIGIYLCKILTMRSYPDIARRFGDRDHSTGIHSFRRIEKLMLGDSELAADIGRLREMLNA